MASLQTFYYRLLLPNGRLRSGVTTMAVERDFSVRLRLEREFAATVLNVVRLPQWLGGVWLFLRRLFSSHMRPEELAGFLRDLGIMQSAGVSTLEALQTLNEESRTSGNKRVGALSGQLYDDLNAGGSMTEAFARHPDIFPETVRNLIAIGEQSGTTDIMLGEAAEHMERMMSIRRDIRTSMIYPLFVFSTIIGVAIFWIYYVVPHMADLFAQMSAELPAVTKNLVAFSDTSVQYGPLILILLIAIAVMFSFAMRRFPRFRLMVHESLHRIPVIRVLVTASGMAHITEHLAILVRAGLDVIKSIDILARATKDQYYRRRLEEVSKSVARGDSIASSMRRAGGFPPMAIRMISVGEESGQLDDQLTHLAKEYRTRLDTVVKSLAEILKPAVILVAGGLFLFLIVALLLPVYDMVRQSVQLG